MAKGPKPVVFLGPSLPVLEAQRILDAEYRPPVRRGDLNSIGNGTVVGIIDGVFGQDLSVSPLEIRLAIERGVRVIGSSSMGALRASEVVGMEGVGRVFEMFRSGAIEDDDEVALVFDADTGRALSEPMVNIRYAVDRLLKPGTIDRGTADRLLLAAKRLFYPDRSYRRILKDAGLATRPDVGLLEQMLKGHDLKREDAVTLLEMLPTAEARGSSGTLPGRGEPLPETQLDDGDGPLGADPPVYLWEYGERVSFGDLMAFMKVSGTFERHARRAVARYVLEGNTLEVGGGSSAVAESALAELITGLRRQWSWVSAEEARVTLADLGMGSEALGAHLSSELTALSRVKAVVREDSPDFRRALRAELILDDLALKRETIRAGTIARWAGRERAARSPAPTPDENEAVRARICGCLDALNWRHALEVLESWGLSSGQAEEWVEHLALARRVGGAVIRAMAGVNDGRARHTPRTRTDAFGLKSSPKQPGDARFTLPLSKALQITRRLRGVVGITRVAVITGLDVVGIPNASAYRSTGVWSSTIGSGKAETVTGAKVGAVMEECEKWAVEQYPRRGLVPPEVVGSYAQLRRKHAIVEPSEYPLPHDSSYAADLEIGWRRCTDLIGGGEVLVPTSFLDVSRQRNDILFSPRLAMKCVSTNGLASGFTREEALVHAACEAIERHATKVASLVTSNPGIPGVLPRFIDARTLPRSSARLFKKLSRGGRVRIADITGEVRVPSFWVTVLVERPAETNSFAADRTPAEGFATHPNPEVALNMALMEAAQTLVINVSGAREDLTLFARSLGRHERTRAVTRDAWRQWNAPEAAGAHFSSVEGHLTNDCLEDFRWLILQLTRAGCRNLMVADYSVPELSPVKVLRVLIPELDSVIPVHTGDRPRACLLTDWLPSP